VAAIAADFPEPLLASRLVALSLSPSAGAYPQPEN
jgi:hypothetical protein